MDEVKYGGKIYQKIYDNNDIESCKKCCFHFTESNGDITCDSPCNCAFWGCGDGSFHWEKK